MKRSLGLCYSTLGSILDALVRGSRSYIEIVNGYIAAVALWLPVASKSKRYMVQVQHVITPILPLDNIVVSIFLVQNPYISLKYSSFHFSFHYPYITPI